VQRRLLRRAFAVGVVAPVLRCARAIGCARCGSRCEYGHDALAQAGTRREDPVVAELVGARGRDQRNEPVEQVAAFYQDVEYGDVLSVISVAVVSAEGEKSRGEEENRVRVRK
jgi:hypothetical protein